MGLLKKKKGAEDAAVTEQKTQSAPAAPKKKKKDSMSSILSESVIETAVEDAAKNTAFVVNRNGEEMYVGILLAADDIGGINKKCSKDEAKGSIIEMINSGLIKTLITPQLMDDEKLVIIPDAPTLQGMDEFSLLTEAKYELVYIHTDGGVELTGKPVAFKSVLDVLNENVLLSSVTGEDEEYDDSSGYDDMSDDYDESMPEIDADSDEDIPDLPDDVSDDEPEDLPDDIGDEQPFDDEPSFGDESDDDDGQPFDDEPYGEFDDDSGQSFEEEYDDGDGQSFDESDDEENYDEGSADDDETSGDDAEISDEQVLNAITRKFYSEELGLEVSTEAFDVQFLHGNTYVPLIENRPKGWLNNYLNEESRAANVELKKLHQQNIYEMREFYARLISAHCDKIQKQLDANNPETQFGKILDDLKHQKRNAEAMLDDEIAKKRAIIEEDWNRKLNEAGESAAESARAQYKARFAAQHEEDLRNVRFNLEDQVERDYRDEVRKLNGSRRAEAAKRLDYGIHASLQQVAGLYGQKIEEEAKAREGYEKHIKDYIESHLTDEISRTKALEDELARKNEADEARAECAERIKAITAEFDAKSAKYKSDIEHMEKDMNVKINNIEDECQRKIEKAEERNEELVRQIDDLNARYQRLDETKKQEYQARITELQSERDAMVDRCKHTENTHKKYSYIAVSLTVIIAIATAAIGFIAGELVNTKFNSSNKQVTASVVQDVNDDKQNTVVQTGLNAVQQPVGAVPTVTEAPATEPAVETEQPVTTTKAAEKNTEKPDSKTSDKTSDDSSTAA